MWGVQLDFRPPILCRLDVCCVVCGGCRHSALTSRAEIRCRTPLPQSQVPLLTQQRSHRGTQRDVTVKAGEVLPTFWCPGREAWQCTLKGGGFLSEQMKATPTGTFWETGTRALQGTGTMPFKLKLGWETSLPAVGQGRPRDS